MNVSRLLELIDLTRSAENEYEVQSRLQQLDDHFQAMIANSQDPNQQTAVVERLKDLKLDWRV